MKVLVLCEESQTITKAFREKDHEAYSCDIQYCSGGHPEWHIQTDAIKLLDRYVCVGKSVDLIIAHPPCTYLSSAGALWWKDKKAEQDAAIDFFFEILSASLAVSSHVCIENPAGIMSTIYKKPTQYINPFQF